MAVAAGGIGPWRALSWRVVMFRMFRSVALATTLALGLVWTAQAATLPFDRITTNSNVNAAGQLSVTVADFGTQARFSFSVLSGAQSGATIKEIYFSDVDGLFTGSPEILTQNGVSYVAGQADPGDLPSGNNASPAFTVTGKLLADIDNRKGGNANGIQIGDLLVLGLNFAAGNTFTDLLARINSGAFRVGLHVGSLNGGASDSFVSKPPTTVVPLPAGLPLMLAGIGALAVLRRRKAA